MILEGLAGSFVAQDLDKAFLLEAGGAAGELGPDLQGFLHIVAHGKLHFEIIPYAKLGLALYPGQAGTDSLFCLGSLWVRMNLNPMKVSIFPSTRAFTLLKS